MIANGLCGARRRLRLALAPLATATALALISQVPVAALTLQVQPAGRTIDVINFGADPADNAHDDTAAMQRAADELCKPQNRGATLRYPRGVYNVDRLTDLDTQFSPDLRAKGVVYDNCRNVTIIGNGARIDVKGDFAKHIASGFTCGAFKEADTFQSIPFAFRNARHIVMRGFEIDGNVDQMTQPDRGVYLCDRNEFGVFIVSGEHITVEGLNVHHMAADGIVLNIARDVVIRRVVSANNVRQALTIGQGRNVLVTRSQFLDTGVTGTRPDSYPPQPHGPGRGVDIEPECTPKGAEWGKYDANGSQADACSDVVGMSGNMLFDRVRVTGNLGGGIIMSHGSATANVTVRDSVLQNPLGRSGELVTMGIVGGILERSRVDSQNGFGVACNTDGVKTQLTSPRWVALLADLANDPSPLAQLMFRQTDPEFSTTVRNNLIAGQGTKILCQDPVPVVKVVANRIRGTVLATPPEDEVFPVFGHMVVFSGATSSPPLGSECGVSAGRLWAKELTVENNDIFLPHGAPRDPKRLGEINYCGSRLSVLRNTYRTDTQDSANPLRVHYNDVYGVGSVTGDCFPATGAIIAVRSNGQPYPLTPQGAKKCLALP